MLPTLQPAGGSAPFCSLMPDPSPLDPRPSRLTPRPLVRQGGALLAHSSSAMLCWHLLSGSLAWMHAATSVLSAATDPQSDSMLIAVGIDAADDDATTADDATDNDSAHRLAAGAGGGVAGDSGEGGGAGGGGGEAAEGDDSSGRLRYAVLEFRASDLLASPGEEGDGLVAAGSVPARVWHLGGRGAQPSSQPRRLLAYLLTC